MGKEGHERVSIPDNCYLLFIFLAFILSRLFICYFNLQLFLACRFYLALVAFPRLQKLLLLVVKSDIMPIKMPDGDQHFLLYFIAGIYFGPDLKGEKPPKSVLQRLAEGLLPYTSDQLAGSHMKMVEVERIFYYVLRQADESLIMKMSLLHQFFQGNFPSQGRDISFSQFPDLFPPEFHPHSRSRNFCRYVDNLTFIHNPEVYYLNSENVERFKRLTGLDDFLLDRDAARSHNLSVRKASLSVEATDNTSNKEFSPPKDDLQYNGNSTPPHSKSDSNPVEKNFGPAMLFLPRQPCEEDWGNLVAATDTGFALTGTAAMGQVGPIIGLMDIGECEDSYLFRVSLPGVKRDGSKFLSLKYFNALNLTNLCYCTGSSFWKW